MERLKKLRCIDSFTLKLLAMALMLCDHMWATIIPGNLWLTCLGRLAFPIFAYQIVEGFFCTRSFRRYWGRLFLFALLSEVPFNLMYGGSPVYPFHQNGLGGINLGMMGGRQFSLSLFGRVWELPQQGLALLALLPIWLYNGQPGRASRPLRLACYAFYPVHMAVLVFLWRMG